MFSFFSLSFPGDKPFSCDICHKKFALSCNLRAHLKTHEAEYASSSASLALYQRALAVLGSQSPPSNSQATDSNGEDEEDNDEARSNASGSPAATSEKETVEALKAARMEFANQLTVAV